MYIEDKNGRQYRIPSEEETKRIREGIAKDPDTHELTDEEMAELRPLSAMKRAPGRPKADARKVSTTIRFDADVLAAMKASGPGWQTRVNDAMRALFMTPPTA